MDFGGIQFSCCEPDFLARMRDVLGYKLPGDRDAEGGWPDEQIQRYLNVDLRWVPHEPPLVAIRECFPALYEEEKARHERAREKHEQSKMPDLVQEFPLAGKTLADVRAMKPELPPPSPYLDWYIRVAKQARANGYATSFSVAAGFFEMGCWKRGYDQISMDLLEDTDLVRALFDLWQAEKLHRIETIVKPLAPYIDLFVFGDDLGMQTGLFMSPETYREMIMPYMRTVYGRVHAVAPNSFVFHHSCGSVYRLLDEFVEIGINVLNPIQPNAADMSPEQLKQKGRGRLCYHGGMDLQQLLPFGTPDEVKAEAERRMRILGKGGGYICAAAHTLPADVPLENILALFQAKRQ
jgi:uroporphyrinogen decarboxylase